MDDLIETLIVAETKLRVAALDKGAVGLVLEQKHMEGLADAIGAQIRIERSNERAALAAI